MNQEFKWHMDIKQYLASINNTQNLSGLNGETDPAHFYRPNWFDSGPVILLIILYCIVVFGGVFGNASLVITLCTQTSTRFRNPLLVALCVADLMVTGVSAPLTIVALAITNHTSWTVAGLTCKTIYFMQVSEEIRFICV